MTTLSTPDSIWTPTDLRAWRRRLGWTQARAAAALLFHVEAYKKLECGTGANAIPVAFAEVDAAANAVLRHRWPDVPRVGNLTEFD